MGIYNKGSGHHSSSLGFSHLSLEHNGKSNIIISTLSHKRQMCVLLLTLCFPQCFMSSLRRCWGLLQMNHKSKTWLFFCFFIAKGGFCLAENWPWLRAGKRPIWQAPLRTEWTAVSDEWPASFLITKHSHQVRHKREGVVAWASPRLAIHLLVTITFCIKTAPVSRLFDFVPTVARKKYLIPLDFPSFLH